MRRISYIVLSAAVALGACKKSAIDLFPYNQVETTQAFNTESDVSLAVNGMYYGIRASGSYYNGTWNILADVLADNLIISQAGRLTLKTYGEWRYQGNSTYGLFGGGYTIVRRANAILENIDRLPAGPFHDNAKGEALGIRALTYFDMSRVYSKTYQNASASDSTVPYVTTTDPTIMPGKEPVKGFYDKLVTDLTQALTLVNTSNGTGRLNKAAIAGILSRVYLYKGDYTNCVAASTTALGSTPAVADIATFPKIWTDQTEVGVLFKVINNAVDNVNTQGVNYYQTVSGAIKSEYVVEYNLAQMYLPTDVRTSTYIRTGAYLGNTYNNVVKYAGGTGKPAGVQDAKVLRTAEVLLNRAESNYRLGNTSAALDDLRLLKRNRYTGYVNENLAGQPLLDEILNQRRLELAFEGDRFWDLKRRNQPVVRDATKGEYSNGKGTPFVFTNLAAGDYRFNLPLPQSELNFNTTLTQNQGY
jgi:hypothetical protein